MSFLTRIFNRSPETRGITYTLGTQSGLIDSPTRSGVSVSEQSAIGIPALWAGIRIISSDVGSLEPILYRESPDGTRTTEDRHPLASVLADTPNPEMTRPVFWETMMSHALLWGGMYAEIQRDGAGQVVALWPLHPRNVAVVRDSSGQLTYRVTVAMSNLDPDHEPGQQIYLSQADVFHVPGLSPDGVVGYRLIQSARETLGFGLAAQRYGSSWFANATRPGGTLTTPGELNEVARENLRKSWSQLHGGADQAGKVALLENGVAFAPMAQNNEQGQYKDILSWYVSEVARLLVISPTKLFDLSRATWANLETLNQDHLNTCLRPWLEKIEAEVERKLLSVDERDSLYVEFDTTSLLRADIAARYSAYAVALSNKFMSVNEVRARENLPPIDGGDTISPTPAPATIAPVPEGDIE